MIKHYSQIQTFRLIINFVKILNLKQILLYNSRKIRLSHSQVMFPESETHDVIQ